MRRSWPSMVKGRNATGYGYSYPSIVMDSGCNSPAAPAMAGQRRNSARSDTSMLIMVLLFVLNIFAMPPGRWGYCTYAVNPPSGGTRSKSGRLQHK